MAIGQIDTARSKAQAETLESGRFARPLSCGVFPSGPSLSSPSPQGSDTGTFSACRSSSMNRCGCVGRRIPTSICHAGLARSRSCGSRSSAMSTHHCSTGFCWQSCPGAINQFWRPGQPRLRSGYWQRSERTYLVRSFSAAKLASSRAGSRDPAAGGLFRSHHSL